MTRYTLIISNEKMREKAVSWCQKAPVGMRLDFKLPKRTLPQNDRLWSLLTEIAEQVTWHGVKLTPNDFKLMFLDALKREVRMVPNLDGNGFVQLGRSSSDLSKDEMGMLFEIIAMFGAQHGVVFHDGGQE